MAQQQAYSSTNFDFLSLHLLNHEIGIILKDAEIHLREFYDDPDQAPLLTDSAKNLSQLAKVFSLISFDGADFLATALADAYTKLSQSAGDDEQEAFMVDISEAVMMLERYVEFTLLKEQLEPSLLLPIINKLRQHLAQNAITDSTLRQTSHSVVINHPQSQYAPLSSLGLNTKALIGAYRQGLSVLLRHQAGTPSPTDLQKIQGLSNACANIAQHSDTLFWQSAKALTQDIIRDLPLSHAKKRILIYLEQQLSDYFDIHDKRFAHMVSMACQKDVDFALLATQKYALNQTSADTLQAMQRFLFGPNREIISTVNTLIQETIESIKHDVDTLVRTDGQVIEGEPITPNSIATDINKLAKTLHLLQLTEARDALIEASKQVNAWQRPTLEELDTLLDKLLIAENSAIFLAKSHTPKAVKFQRHDHGISLHHLDMACETLVKEARYNLLNISSMLSDFLGHRQDANLQEAPELIRQVSGAVAFLHMPAISKQLIKLAHKLDTGLLNKIQQLPAEQVSQLTNHWADILVTADMELENFTENRPTSEQMLLTSERSLNRLLVA
ncbi:MAG: hypothetical protein Q3971_08045 [Moraxella sp.]|nr:hypothetical protein [Moraxella sp.]